MMRGLQFWFVWIMVEALLVEEPLVLVLLVMCCNANMVMLLATIQHTLMEQLNLICILMSQSQAEYF